MLDIDCLFSFIRLSLQPEGEWEGWGVRGYQELREEECEGSKRLA